jgi:hypothetical protein
MKSFFTSIIMALLITMCARSQNPFIQDCITQVKADSIQTTLEHLQAFGTRYALADNRKEVANWIAGKFLQYGYADVKLDSFQAVVNYPGVGDTAIWHYNVVCSVTGASAPEEVCIIGGHCDSYADPDPFTLAPGVDDNGSAVAATLETARVMKLMNVQPESTVRFILYAGEEIGYLGSHYQAQRSVEMNEDIRLMFNIDMIAFNPDSLEKVFLFRYKNFESAFNIASDVYQTYTGLSVFTGPPEFEYRSDSYTYWNYGYPSTWAFEYDFNDFYHSEADVVSNCNLDYCAEVTRGALATILEMQFRPFPPGIVSKSSADNVTISWRPTANIHKMGYDVFRSENDSAGFVPLNSALVTDTFFVDQILETGKDYYYYVRLVNDSLQESSASNTVRGVKFGFTDTLLVVACLKSTQTTPDSTLQFYASVLDSIPYRWFDMNQSNPLTLRTLSTYRNTLWVVNSLEYDQISDEAASDLGVFFENGGNMMFAGFSFSRFINGGIGFPYKHPEGSVGSRYFKVDSVYKTINSYMYQAYPDEEGYDTLRVDPDKTMKPGYPGELYNIEVFTPLTSGTPIYRFDSHYDPGTTQGSQQDKITGVEYMGQDFKTILLSFPLLYIDTGDARKLMNYVMKNKFGNPTGIPSITNDKLQMTNWPNPFREYITVSYSLDEPAEVTLQIYNNVGQTVTSISGGFRLEGEHSFHWDAQGLPPGSFFILLKAGDKMGISKVIKL